jgi:hypothetical protein
MATDIKAQISGENQEAKRAGIGVRDLPVVTHRIPHPCQPATKLRLSGKKRKGRNENIFARAGVQASACRGTR